MLPTQGLDFPQESAKITCEVSSELSPVPSGEMYLTERQPFYLLYLLGKQSLSEDPDMELHRHQGGELAGRQVQCSGALHPQLCPPETPHGRFDSPFRTGLKQHILRKGYFPDRLT